jgi:hypothetical protein
VLPAHGPVPADTAAAITTALRRMQRLVDDPDGAVWYGARRIFAYALMIRNGIPVNDIEAYLDQRAWLRDAAELLGRSSQDLATELIETMLGSGAITRAEGRLHASADHTRVPQANLELPLPREWR